jgi:hypothetical protein
MQPQATFLQDIAMTDPIAAYGIVLGIPRIPISFNASGVFSSAALGQLPIESGLDTTIAQRTWIDNMQYSLQQPNSFTGQVFKTLSDAMLKQATGIAVRCTVHSGPRYLVSPSWTPLENFVNLISSRWAAGWPLFKQQNIQVEFMLTQAPTSVPYNVTLTFNGWQFLDHTVDEISVDVAASKLRALGLFVPDAVRCP